MPCVSVTASFLLCWKYSPTSSLYYFTHLLLSTGPNTNGASSLQTQAGTICKFCLGTREFTQQFSEDLSFQPSIQRLSNLEEKWGRSQSSDFKTPFSPTEKKNTSGWVTIKYLYAVKDVRLPWRLRASSPMNYLEQHQGMCLHTVQASSAALPFFVPHHTSMWVGMAKHRLDLGLNAC